MNTDEKKNKIDPAKSKLPEKADKTVMSERERHKGRLDNEENKARSTEGKARAKKAGHEAVSDQKSHEYH